MKDCSSSSCEDCNEASITPTPFVSAPSSPSKSTHDLATSDFDFRVCIDIKPGPSPLLYPGTPAYTIMSTAEELFHNGQIKPLDAMLTSSIICCNHAIKCGGYCDFSVSNGHTYTPSCPQCAACKGGNSLSQNVEQHSVPQTPGGQEQYLVKLAPSVDQGALEQCREKGVDQEDDKWPNARHAHAYQYVGRVTQIPSLPLASYGKSRGGPHHRRARSLSPLRVFHMDDIIQPRPSFDSELYTHGMSSQVKDPDVGITRPRRRSTRKSWTLKEILNLGDNKVHEKRPHLGSGEIDQVKLGRKGNLHVMEKRADFENVGDKESLAEDSWHNKSNTHLLTGGGMFLSSPWKLQRGHEALLKRAEDVHIGKETQTEDRLKKCGPSYKNGLLGCLGFTSKINSVKGLHAMHFNGG